MVMAKAGRMGRQCYGAAEQHIKAKCSCWQMEMKIMKSRLRAFGDIRLRLKKLQDVSITTYRRRAAAETAVGFRASMESPFGRTIGFRLAGSLT